MTDTATKEKEAVKAPPKKVLSPASLKLAQHARTEYHVTVEQDITLQDIAKASFWEHHARRLKPGDIVEILCEDMSWSACVMILGKPGNSVMIGVMSYAPFTKEAEKVGKVDKKAVAADKAEMPEDKPRYIARWNPGKKSFTVRLNEDGSEWIGDGHPTMEAAQTWIRGQEKALER